MRRSVLAVGLLALLAGCSSGASDEDVAAWSEWQQELIAARQEGSVAVTGRAVETANGSTATLGLAQPMRVTGIELACTGTARMIIGYELVASAASDSGNVEIDCDGSAHPASVPPEVAGQEIRSASFSAMSDGGVGAWGASLLP